MTPAERLRILHLAGWYPSKKNPVFGIFVKEHAKATALYNDVIVLSSEGINHRIRGVYRVESNLEEGIRTLRLSYRKSLIPRTTYFIYLWSIFRAFNRLVREGFKPDVVHAHVYSAGVPAVLIGKLFRIPVVVTEHSSAFPRRLISVLEKLKAKFAFGGADIVCPVSGYLKRHIEAYDIKARFRIVPNVVDTSLFAPKDGIPLEVGNRKRLLLVAILTPVKGVPYLLEALRCLREKRDDFLLDIVGDGPNREEYEELTCRLGLQNVVRFHGLKSRQEIAWFMRRTDFLVLPSLFETFGVVLIEALACGKPVVATNIGGPSEIVNEKVGLLVPPADSTAMAEAVNHMLDHYQDYDPGEIYKYARSRYSCKVVGKEWDFIYRSLIRS